MKIPIFIIVILPWIPNCLIDQALAVSNSTTRNGLRLSVQVERLASEWSSVQIVASLENLRWGSYEFSSTAKSLAFKIQVFDSTNNSIDLTDDGKMLFPHPSGHRWSNVRYTIKPDGKAIFSFNLLDTFKLQSVPSSRILVSWNTDHINNSQPSVTSTFTTVANVPDAIEAIPITSTAHVYSIPSSFIQNPVESKIMSIVKSCWLWISIVLVTFFKAVIKMICARRRHNTAIHIDNS